MGASHPRMCASGCKSSRSGWNWGQVILEQVQVVDDMGQVIMEWVQVGASHQGFGASGCKSSMNVFRWVQVI
jgi:hypothetical protein